MPSHLICPQCGEQVFVEFQKPGREICCPSCQSWFPTRADERAQTDIPVLKLVDTPDATPATYEELSPWRHTTLVRYSLVKALWNFFSIMMFSLGLLVLAYFFIPMWWAWASLVFGVVGLLVGGFDGMKILNREPILIIDERGFTDIREPEGRKFLPWSKIGGASSFRVSVNMASVTHTLTIHRLVLGGKVVDWKIDADGLTLTAARIADVIDRHLRALGRDPYRR